MFRHDSNHQESGHSNIATVFTTRSAKCEPVTTKQGCREFGMVSPTRVCSRVLNIDNMVIVTYNIIEYVLYMNCHHITIYVWLVSLHQVAGAHVARPMINRKECATSDATVAVTRT